MRQGERGTVLKNWAAMVIRRIIPVPLAAALLLSGCAAPRARRTATFGVRIGQNAVVHDVPRPDWIEGMQFISNRTGFVAEQTMPWSVLSGAPSPTPGGTLKVTQDGAGTWQHYPLPPIVVTGIDFLTASHGFAYGKAAGRAALYQTEDGGRVWAPLISRPLNPSKSYQETLDDMHFWSSQGGDLLLDGHLYLTSDGGQAWRAASLPTGAEDTVFVDHGQGFAITATTIYETNDGAHSWQAVYELPSNLIQSAPALTSPVPPFGLNATAGVPVNLLAVSQGTVEALFAEGPCGPYSHCASYLVRETAGHFAAPAQATALWPLTASQVLLLHGLLAAGVPLPANGRMTIPGGTTAVSSPFPGSIWVTSGGGWNGSSVYYSRDGGLHWTEASPRRPNLGIQFATVRDGYGFEAGASGLKFLATSDGGLHWKVRSALPGQLQIDGFGFGPKGTGYLFASASGSTPSGEVLRTADGGRTWTVVFRSPQAAAWQRGLDVSVISRDVVVASDEKAVIASRDGGKTWRQTASLPGYSSTTYFSNSNDGWAAAGGELYRTQDGGRHWRSMGNLNPDNRQPPPEVISFAFPGSQSVWMGVASGNLALLRSQDGGTRWTERSFPDTYVFGSYLADAQRELSVASPSVAYLDNFSGVYRTTDGGKTWNRLTIR